MRTWSLCAPRHLNKVRKSRNQNQRGNENRFIDGFHIFVFLYDSYEISEYFECKQIYFCYPFGFDFSTSILY